MSVGMNGPNIQLPSYGSLDAIRAAAQSQADAALPGRTVPPAGQLNWVDRPADVVGSVNYGASRLLNWMTGWRPPNPQQPSYQTDPQLQPLQHALAQVRARGQQLEALLHGQAAAHAQPPATASMVLAPANPNDDAWSARLKTMKPAELAALGQTDKAGFFAALRPAADAAQKKYGVPAAVILAQAALETGWGTHLASGLNLFGHKGEGPAGSNTSRTREVENGRDIYINAKFARYNNFFEGVEYHGKWFHNGYYDLAVNNYRTAQDPDRFARDITGIYATDPSYAQKLIQIMNAYRLK
jgi:flagellum-specific peptidoglycan hydrolase FlgJ